MELASEFIIGIGGLVIGLAMLWFGMLGLCTAHVCF